MTANPAIGWLEDQFSDLWTTWELPGKNTPGTAVIKPMIQLRSVMDPGTPMHVSAHDYDDPERWWL